MFPHVPIWVKLIFGGGQKNLGSKKFWGKSNYWFLWGRGVGVHTFARHIHTYPRGHIHTYTLPPQFNHTTKVAGGYRGSRTDGPPSPPRVRDPSPMREGPPSLAREGPPPYEEKLDKWSCEWM